jgi:hypothetical protein
MTSDDKSLNPSEACAYDTINAAEAESLSFIAAVSSAESEGMLIC